MIAGYSSFGGNPREIQHPKGIQGVPPLTQNLEADSAAVGRED